MVCQAAALKVVVWTPERSRGGSQEKELRSRAFLLSWG